MKNSQTKEPNRLGNYLGLFFIGFILGGFIFGIILEKQQEPIVEIVEIEKEQPMILVYFDSWGENINDSEELIFSYFVYNFGNTEAKNITILCELSLDLEQEYIVWEENYTIGNLASNSGKYYESYMKYYSDRDEYYGSCKLISADGDYINLRDRLSDI